MQVALVGVSGYSGMVLYRLLKQHPNVDHINLYGHSDAQPMPLKTLVPMYQKETALVRPFVAATVMAENDVCLFATSAGVTKTLALPLLQADFPVIDLSGDFRLKQPAQYEQWYHQPAAPQAALMKASYGLADLNVDLTAYVANPGCYATATLLGLAPLVQQHLIDPTSIIVDAKSGVSGAGKKLAPTSHFVAVNDNLQLYKLNQHQHIPEIMQQLQAWWSAVPALEFTTTLIPVTRGIMSSIYATAAAETTTAQVLAAFEQTYADSPFVTVLPTGMPDLKQVIGTNNCALGVNYNPVTHKIMVVSVIDNLMKGAAGQAIQNLNQLFQLPITAGLPTLPVFP
ncbi:N-acetyl-gamma-glutamyl-phosphate reductase [Lactiplantibacillus fabifermentans]|uniref:N-acetyl-gamma-glutamyl-phosphate reductase n=2 Tax=Lactiplantibacillus fabifermentans TaxID=483011 RepID=A0A0R2NSP2_9LACO|nr:N-acetyl-gamma-glutamyl-phosphate reductase [Lactiplantibacillus fabifermentans]ETY75345.1 N-acetyl-gamma-glutamyl-phosphate reductase [Lactiplantibacillus fabifermentans T30PCM01]KRO28696.1 n-acetyl-gamma-glutamyl-phosphate reductase (agpr) [Lactiplantibacillus fabifermentans DSM 21115]